MDDWRVSAAEDYHYPLAWGLAELPTRHLDRVLLGDKGSSCCLVWCTMVKIKTPHPYSLHPSVSCFSTDRLCRVDIFYRVTITLQHTKLCWKAAAAKASFSKRLCPDSSTAGLSPKCTKVVVVLAIVIQ
jgi:hypothetical protein